MSQDLLLPIAAVLTFALWLASRHVLARMRERRQREVASRGAAAAGRIVAIQRPFLLDAYTRLYFDFVPEGGDRPLRVCHVDRRPLAELAASLPLAGAVVTVRYLPHRPHRAVISRLVAH